MTPRVWKRLATTSALLFLFSAAVTHRLGGTLADSLVWGAIVVGVTVAVTASLLLVLFLLVVASGWVIGKVAPQGETCSCLLEALWLRGVAFRQQSRHKEEQKQKQQ